ncbi:class I SAM-dependent methyltransferase [Marinomonas spartinae]|uniref:class I SAM-dependent methyltransferase n=1 Tax=Marinomonas spartinae TaxID=1792290 RepID=UPI0018F19A1B|nr:class I SAM-dependent methyltransferase [Marinomonas spartinae]MBJ7553962.1 class I SAM-dependent methyltransferase [Marinomonas spartinae]
MAIKHEQKEKFDGLADDYDSYRPRYPRVLFETLLASLKHRKDLTLVDVGAGTGIALESMIEVLGRAHHYHAIDISSDMIDHGKRKFPDVNWHKGKAEDVLLGLESIDLIIAAQSFQWMDRPSLLSAIDRRLKVGGIFGVIQNNRYFEGSDFLDEYESLLERMSPGYSRYYRKFDFLQEMKESFGSKSNVTLHTHDWVMTIPSNAFIGMSRSSTQAQRAITAHGEAFINQLTDLITRYEKEGLLEIAYRSELFMYSK